MNLKFFMVIVAFALVAATVSNVNAQPPTLLWSDPISTLGIAVSKDGQYVASVASSPGFSGVRFYSRNSGTPLWTYSVPGTWFSVAISADGDCVVAGNASLVVFWKNARSLTGTPGPLWSSIWLGPIEQRCLDMSADGNYVVACGTGDGVYYWADAKGKSGSNVPWTWTYFFSPTTEVFGVDLSSNGDFVVAGTAGYIGPSGPSKVAYWKNARFLTGTGQPPNWASTEAGDSVLDVAVSDDGDYVAAAAEVNTVYYWAGAKLLTGDPSSRWYSGLSAYFLCVDMSSDGGSVIAGSTDKVYFWSDARGLTGKPQGWSWTYTTLGAVHDVAINHAGDYMAAANDVATPYVYFFDYRGNLLWSYGPLLDEVQALSISSDGGTLAAGAGLFFTTAYLFSTGYSTPQPVGGTIVPGSVVVATPYVIMLVAVASVVAIIAAGVKKRGH